MNHRNLKTALSDCAVVGIEDARWREAIVPVAVAADPSADREVMATELYRFSRDNLAGFKVPKIIPLLRVLPRSHFGKVLKRDLREFLFERFY